jgi:hypothetical protein
MTFRTSSTMLTTQLLIENEMKMKSIYADSVKSSQLEDELAVDVLTNMIKLNDVPDLQRLAIACLQIRLYLIAQKLDTEQMICGDRLSLLIAPEEKLIKSISINDLNSILNIVNSNASGKKRKSPFMESPVREDDDLSDTSSTFEEGRLTQDRVVRRKSLPVYEFLSHGSRVRVVKTGQYGVVVGEKNGGWRIIEMTSASGSKVYGTYRPSDMAPAE